MFRATDAVIHQGGKVPDTFGFRVAGVGIRVQADDIAIRSHPERQRFTVSHEDTEITLKVRAGRLDSDPSGRLLFDSGALWRAYADHGEFVYRFSAGIFGSAPYKELRMADGFHTGEIILHTPYLREKPIDPLEYPLDELLVVHCLGKGLGIELHACGIIDSQGRGWIFSGHSGAGKSTLARLWSQRDVSILSDDRIILRKMNGECRIFGTPWHGEAGFAKAESAPLAGILLIEHGIDNEIEEITPVQAVSELMARAFLPFYEERALETAVSVLSDTAAAVPCCRFHFRPDVSAIDQTRAWMEWA